MTKSLFRPVRLIALDEASELISGQRDQEYGSPRSNFDRFTNMVNEYLGDRLAQPLDARDAAAILCLLKLSRAAHDSSNLDSWRDLVGYAALGFEMAAPEAYSGQAVPTQPKTPKRRGRPRKAA